MFVEDGLNDRLVGKAELRLNHPLPQAAAQTIEVTARVIALDPVMAAVY